MVRVSSLHHQSNYFIGPNDIKNSMKGTLLHVSTALILIILVVPSITSFSAIHPIPSTTVTPEDQKVLLTGFGPFSTFDVNPSQLIVETLNGSMTGGALIIGAILPVDFEESIACLVDAIEQCQPDVIICLGLSPSATALEIERIGVNLKQEDYDNPWSIPRRLDPKGPFIRWSTLPTKAITKAIREEDIPAVRSWSAGFYVCNAVLYEMLGYLKAHDLCLPAGFIHVPPLVSQRPEGMELTTMVEAIECAIEISLTTTSITSLPAG
jgi:pyroglutamyl-peptidase